MVLSSKKYQKTRRSKHLCQLDTLMRGVKEALVLDLSSPNLDRICRKYERGLGIPGSSWWSPYMFKKLQQIRNFDKRVIWPDDKSFDELSKEAFTGFIESQKQFVCPEPMSLRATLATQRAREICHKILGEFSWDVWLDSCSYGKRAAYKLPRSEAYLDVRVESPSGSVLQSAVFKSCLARDVHLLRAVRKGSRSIKTYDLINATAVPKSFKSARIIAPGTVLGGFLSRGLGNYVRERLEKETHIDLAKQQDRHRRWARVASVTGHLATLDMSKASDSFVRRHIELLVPKSWIHALECVRVPTIMVGDTRTELTSWMLMGEGHTFPLQTLLFFCLAEATRTLLNCRGKVSVYGDDIIVPTRMSSQLIALMSELGFTINSEKSFYDSPDPDRPSHSFFRESCGGDYKGGVDVRPYMPECDLQSDGMVPPNEYLAWCHKMINGLLDRWEPYEIPITLNYLLRAITSRKRKICFVPAWEVDHAGIKHHIPPSQMFGLEAQYITYKASHPVYWKLTFSRRKRPRKQRERPYVWYAYYLQAQRCLQDSHSPLVFSLISEEERARSVRDWETSTPLNGEPDRRRKGSYRWSKFGPKEF